MARKQNKRGEEIFVDRMLDWTQRLVRVDEHEGNETASGLLYQRDNRVFLLSVGHALNHGQWVIETNWAVNHQVLSFTMSKPTAFHGSTEDFAWAELDVPAIAAQLKEDNHLKDKDVNLCVYKGPIDAPPAESMAYGFATWKAAEFVTGMRALVRDPVYELNLKYDGIEPTTKLLTFLPNHPHPGHKHYKGSSGSPIAGVDGKVVALVVRGYPEKNPTMILGVPLQNHAEKIGA
jgi:hypothetical protein